MSALSTPVNYLGLVEYPGYLVGDDGSIWSYRYGNSKKYLSVPYPRSQRLSTHGYWRVDIRINGVIKPVYPHKLVLWNFVGPCPAGMECRHLDGDRTNNSLGNLCRGTRVENSADKVVHGTDARGSRHGNAKLTEAQIPSIRCLRASGLTYKAIGLKYGVNYKTISRICKGAGWVHVP